MTGPDLVPSGYADLLADLKARVRATQFRAARAANTEVLALYWSIGRDILDRQERDGWGAKVVDRLAADLQREFPDQRGWSRSNLMYMRKVAETWPTEAEFVQHAAGQLPWGHVLVLIDRLSTRDERDWYAHRCAAEGWTRNVLEHHSRSACVPQSAPRRRTSTAHWIPRTPSSPSSSSKTPTCSSTSAW